MSLYRASGRTNGSARAFSLGFAALLACAAVYPSVAHRAKAAREETRLDRLPADDELLARGGASLDATLSIPLRARQLGPLLASWETIGGCGAGGTGGTGTGVKWIGHNTTGGLFHSQFMFNYVTLPDGYNVIASAQIDRDIDTRQKWNAGVVVPVLYKYYRNYLKLTPPVDISNSGLGDINALLTRRLGSTNATSVTASVGFPTGTYDAEYKHDLLSQDKQLGLGNLTGGLMLDHTIDETWGLIVLGAMGALRGGTNRLGSYRAPMGTVYAYGGYFLGPLVPTLGVGLVGFTAKDQDRGIEQDLPLYLGVGNASIEWATDYVAVLLGTSIPFALSDLSIQPWTVALGVSVSPF